VLEFLATENNTTFLRVRIPFVVKRIATDVLLFSLNFVYIINRKIHGCLEIPDLFLVLNMISHSFAALTREVSCSTLEINLVFPRTHVLFSLHIIPSPSSLLCFTLDTSCLYQHRSWTAFKFAGYPNHVYNISINYSRSMFL
jgi:hypothetical protein